MASGQRGYHEEKGLGKNCPSFSLLPMEHLELVEAVLVGMVISLNMLCLSSFHVDWHFVYKCSPTRDNTFSWITVDFWS
ncbi:UNVERIFIED_CONTAM: hypothetical protein K2H54_029307 [Gekko kuhli]